MTREDFHHRSPMPGRLPVFEPEEARAERIRNRCHARLAARRQRQAARAAAAGGYSWRQALAVGIAAVACGGYLLEVLRRAGEVYGF